MDAGCRQRSFRTSLSSALERVRAAIRVSSFVSITRCVEVGA
jgi:hypothetical protein